MKKLTMVAMLAIVALFGLSGAATASTIEVTNLGGEALNVTATGRITFRSNVATVICDKTMNGHLNARTIGTLGLLANEAGFISDIRLANCEGGTAEALVNATERAVRLSWVEIRNGVEAKLGGNNARFVIGAIGVRCLYTAEMIGAARVERGGSGLYREGLELSLLRVVEDPGNSIFCPRRENITMIGTLAVTNPARGIGVTLR